MQRSILRLLLSLLVLTSVVPQLSDAQSGLQAIDVRPFTPFSGSSFESVSLVNGSLNLNIPVWSFAQRGNLQLDFFLRYDSPTYHYVYDCVNGVSGQSASAKGSAQPNALPTSNTCQYPLCNASHEACNAYWDIGYDDLLFPFGLGQGVRLMASTDVAVTLSSYDGGSPAIQSWYWLLHSPDGSSHKMVSAETGAYRPIDGSGWRYTPADCTLRDDKGSRYVFSCTQAVGYYSVAGTIPGPMQYAEDTNGNKITLNYQHDNATNTDIFTGWTDTMGRSIPSPALAQQSGQTSSACPAGSNAPSSWQLPDASPIVICGVTVNVHTSLLTGVQQNQGPYSEYVGSFDTIGALILPSGDRWTFTYTPLPGDQYYGSDRNMGELRTITLPTGGVTRYHWGHSTNVCGVLPGNSLSRSNVGQKETGF